MAAAKKRSKKSARKRVKKPAPLPPILARVSDEVTAAMANAAFAYSLTPSFVSAAWSARYDDLHRAVEQNARHYAEELLTAFARPCECGKPYCLHRMFFRVVFTRQVLEGRMKPEAASVEEERALANLQRYFATRC